MALYRITAPNGLTYQIEGPEGASQEEVAMAVMAKNPESGTPFKEAGASFGDTAVAGLQSAVGTAKSTLQGFGAEAPGVETLGNLQKGLGQLYTPERQAEQARRNAIEKAAAKSGSTLEEIKASAAGVAEAPIQATASAVGSSIPTVALSIGAAALASAAAVGIGLVGAPALAFAAAVGIGTKYALGALQGAGSVKGSIYDAVKEEVSKQYPDLSKEEVSKIALEAQSFTGKNWDNIMAGTGIGAVAGGTGLEKDLLKKLSKPVAEAAAKKAGEEVAKKGIIAGTKRATGTGLREAIPEGIQGGQEQFAANVAQTREGFETPAMQGVLGAATKEGIMGMLGGAAVSPFTSPSAPAPTAPPTGQPGQPTPNELEALVQQRRLERQQEQMGVKEGRAAREGEKLLDAEAQVQADQERAVLIQAEQAAAKELQALRDQRQAELEQTFPKDYSDVMQKTNSYAELFQEKQALLGQKQTKDVRERLFTVNGLMTGIVEEDSRVPNEFRRMQAENAKVIKQLPEDLQAKYAATAFTVPQPQQMEIRAATVEQTPVPQTDLLGQPVTQLAPAPAAPEKFKTVQTVEEAQAALDLQNRREAREGQAERNAAKDAGQLGLFTRVGTPTAEAEVAPPKIIVQKPPVTEPVVLQKPTPLTVAPVITSEALGVLGIGPTAVMRKPGHAIQGLDITKPEDAAEVKNMLTIYKEGRSPGIVEKVDTFLSRPEFQAIPAPKVETAPTVTETPAPTITEAPKVEAPKVEMPVAPKNAGYHAGDLGYGKDTTLGKMAGGRSTGHFGTGVYFVGSPDNIPAMTRGDRPVNTVDLAKYNLAKPRSPVAAGDLHEGLKAVNSLVGQDLNNETAQRKINDAAFKIWANAGSKASEEQVKTAVTNAIQEATTARTDDVIFESTYIDSASTRAMKALGFEGVDVRNIPGFDNTEFGTVVYAPSLAPAQPTGQTAEKKAANKAAQPSVKKATQLAQPAPTPAPIVTAPTTTPAPIKVVKKGTPKTDLVKVEPVKEAPKVDKALDKARETVDDLDLDPETTKTKVKSFAKRLHKAGLIDDISLNAVESISKDKDMGYEDLLDEVRFALDAYERQQGQAPETKPETKKVTDENNIIEGETRVLPDSEQKLLEGPVGRLQDDQVEELEEFYGVDKSNPEFWKKLRADVTKSINEGSKAVAKAIREIVNQIASGVLAAGLIFNPNGLTNQYNINIQKTFQETISITAPVPEVAKSKMSPLAQDVYGAMAPVAMKTGKWFIVADKPNGMMHVFKEDGSHAISDATLYGKDAGDVLDKVSSLEGGPKITPAGKFTMKESPADYAGGTSLILVESKDHTGYIAIHAADVSTPSENRLGRLDTPSTADNRISYGCINTKHGTFINEIKPNIASLDGGLIFVLPETAGTTAEMFKPETKVVERTETPTTAKAETGRDVAKKEERIEGTESPTRARITDDQNAVDNPISNADLEGIVADVKKSLGGEVEVTILDSAKDLDSKAPAGAAGLVNDGSVYLFRDGIKSGIEGAKTVFHELFHLGLQKLLPNSKEYHRVMINLYRMNARVREMADKWIASQEGQDAKAGYAKEYSNVNDQLNALTAHGTDEALARIAEELKTGEKIGTGQRAFVRSIAKWLADVAEKIGMRQVAQSIRSATYTEVEKFVQEAMTAAVGAGPVNVRLTRRFSVPGGIDENTRRAVQAIQDKTPEKYKEPEKKTILQQIKSIKEVETRDKAKLMLRQKAADKFATVNAKVNQMFSKGYKNAFGDLNPMVLARQAEEARKLVLDFFKAGGIRMAKSGLIETVDTKDSLQNAVEQLVDLAAKNDMTYKEAETYVSSLLEGHRLHNMREEHDKPLEASALILEQQGKNKEADAERKKKLARHMDNADVDTLEAAFQKSPETKAILDTLNATRAQAIDLMVKTGRITKEQGQFWNDNAAYVPFDRVFVETEKPVKGRGTYGISTLRNLPGMEGSFERPIKNVFDSYTGRLSWMITEAVHNNASYNVLDTMALGGFAKELKPKEVPGNKALTVKVYREGKPVEFEVESAADYEAFQTAPELTGWMVSSLVPAARWVRVGVTAFPAFSIKQVIEDAQRSMFNSGVERPLVVGMKTLYNFPRLLTSDALQALGVGKKMPLVREMEKLGIIGDYDVNIINPAQDIKIAAGAEKRGWSGKVYHALEKITKASDLSARLAVFEETLLETGGKKDKDGNITGGDKDLAQLRARELINFSRRGSDPTIRTLSRVVPFMNAYAQGMDVTYRTASGLDAASGSERAEARKQFYKMAMKLTALGFMYALAFGDDEGYKNATDEVRDNNFLIPHTDKKIPLPKEIGFLFKSIPERLVNYYRRYGTDEEQSILNLLGTIVKGGFSAYGTPNATPAQIKPILENMTNYSFFLQRELESASMQRLDPSQRSTGSTSELAKAIGAFSQKLGEAAGTKSLEVSPIKVDNLLRGLFGIAGSSTLLMTDALINPSRPDRPLYQMPFASLFLYNIEGGRAKNEFYDLQNKVSQADMTFKSMQETAPDKAVAYFDKNAALISVAPILNESLKQLSQTRQLRQQLETTTEALSGMTSKERREAIDDIIKQENASLQYVRMLDKQVRDMSK